MGYLYLGLALLTNAAKGFCGKKTSGHTARTADAFLFNLLRMVLCILLGLGLLIAQNDLPALLVGADTLLPALLAGVSTSLFVVAWLLSIRTGALVMLDVFMTLGVLVSVLCSWLFFQEPISLRQTIGLVILLAAVVLMCSYNNSIKGRITPSALMLLLLCGLSNGLTDFSQKLFTVTAQQPSVAAFNFYTYLFSAVTLFLLFLYFYGRTEPHERPGISGVLCSLRPIFGYVLIMAVCLYGYSFFKTQAAAALPAVILYPLHQGCSLLFSCLMAAVLFKEKITWKAIVGLCLAFVALLCIIL